MSRGAESSGGGSSSGNQQPETELDPFFNCRRIDRDTVGLTVLVPGGFIIKEEFNPAELFYNIKEKISRLVTRWRQRGSTNGPAQIGPDGLVLEQSVLVRRSLNGRRPLSGQNMETYPR